ncbi:ubiquitin carboxyl-terminal hydrolase-like protein [Hypoxylon sp. FL1284]|nr:ubiquitin carboxyl-terminal hydrolase-like protein [Hypoxylon sp. FL1284]
MQNPSQPPVERITDQLEVPSLDDRTYRVIRLHNHLEALLVHDPETDKASAALDVNVGNFSDEDEMPGMAHAVEHLLFMGTKKYPVENAYNVYLSSHSGSSNAYTASTSTNFFFDIAAKPSNGEEPSETNLSPLYGGLDRFAQFFIEPLFLSSTLERELRAVDSENKKNLQSDTWRLHQLEKSLSNPKHPYCHFSTGNFEVLKEEPESRGIDVRKKFIDFHEKHYSANRMKLCVLGREPIDVLEKWVAELFSGVPNKDLPQKRWETVVPWTPDLLSMQCFAKPVMDSRELNLYFPFLDEEYLYETVPSRYISHLIGHEGPGSIMVYLKSKGWANSLSAGAYPICPGTPSVFECQIRLTTEGLTHYREVVKVFFQYVSLLRQTPPEEWIFDEQKGMADVDFKYRQKTPASRFTSRISAVMQKPLPREWLLSGQSRLRRFDPASIVAGVELLRPDNFRMTIVSRNFPGDWDQKERWYGTEYKDEKIPEDFLAELSQALNYTAAERLPALHLPHKNQFIPTKLEVDKKHIERSALEPRVIRNDDIARTWYKQDDTFWVPKANLIVSMRNPVLFASADNMVKARLFTDLVRDALEEYSYDAEVAGLQYNVCIDSRGMFIEVSGYNDKLTLLLEQVLITMRDIEIKEERFEIIKERLTRGFKNCELQEPFSQIGDFVSWLTSEHDFVVEQLIAVLPGITAEGVKHLHRQVMAQLHIEVYVHGNVYKEDALKLTDMVEKILKPRALPKEEWPIIRSLAFPPGSNYLFQRPLTDKANVNHCIEYYLHIGDKGNRAIRAKTQFLEQMIHEPAFDQLRTKEQLGYVVFSGLRGTATTYGFRFIIQSERNSEYLESRIDSFLTAQTICLENMTDAEFESHKRSNLDQETGRHWAQISNGYYDFESAQRDAVQVKQLTKPEMIEFYSTYIKPTSPTRSKLVVQLIAQSVGFISAIDYEVQLRPRPTLVEGGRRGMNSQREGVSAMRSARVEAVTMLYMHLRSEVMPSDSCALRKEYCSAQLAAKTSSSKKRKISSRQLAHDDTIDWESNPSSDTPIQSCELDTDQSLSLSTTSDNLPAGSPACRADSIPPASSLPPRLQTNPSSLSYAEYASSAASSPSAAYADLTISSDRGADTPAPDSASATTPSGLYPLGRASSPLTKTTHHRAIMGGASDFPERSSSPLKRRASSMEPDAPEHDANEDVDMITAPSPDASGSSQPQQPADTMPAGSAPEKTMPAATEEEVQPMDISPAHPTPSFIEGHIKAIKAFVDENNTKSFQEGEECFLVSKAWLSSVPIELTHKHTAEDLLSIPPVDNSDIIEEVIDDPLASSDLDVLDRKFVRLKRNYDSEQFEALPPSAWDLLMQWPKLKEGQIPIRRFAHSTKDDGSNVMWEWHPPVLTIYRLWSANSTIPTEASVRAMDPPPVRLARSRTCNFQDFLRQAKKAAGIELSQRVRAWTVLRLPTEEVPNDTGTGTGTAMALSPPASEDGSGSTESQTWKHLLLGVDTFLKLTKGEEREAIDASDLTTSSPPTKSSTKTLSFFGVEQDMAIVLDFHEGGSSWTATFTKSAAQPSNLTVPNRSAKSGRSSPVSQGPLTRGRSQKSGRTLGCVGLSNLGNTCYMNAALQCVRSVEELTKYFLSGEWEKELNRENVLSHNGDIAAAYAQLLKEFYKDPAPPTITPRHFKNMIGKYSTGFSGYGQQDSQEFVGFLLDGLQEDLSRIKKKPYIEKPDSTDDMVNDPDAIREMADKVWDITKKRDDSVIADLFTGLYKSTLVCPECNKISITFDPFNNLTLPLPIESKWSHTVKFFPLNDRPVNIRVELDKHGSIKSLKEYVSTKTGVPIERLFGAEEFKGRFYKHYADLACASDEIQTNDNAHFYELEAKPTNYGGKPPKEQKMGVAVRSMVDEEEHNASASWDDEQAQTLLVPVFHRRVNSRRGGYANRKWTSACVPHFIVVTPQEATSESTIRRKILEKVATFTAHPFFSNAEEVDGSDNTEPEIIGQSGSDAGSSNESRVVAQSVKGEDDMVDVQMKDASDSKGGVAATPARRQFSQKKPIWVRPDQYLPAELQNLFDICFFSEAGAWLPTGVNSVNDDKDYPRLSERLPAESPSSEDALDNATNGTASNEDSSSDDTRQRSTDHQFTRMNQESDEEDGSAVIKTYGKKKNKRQQQRQSKDKARNLELNDSFDAKDVGPDGGPLIRLKEALIVDWSERAYEDVFVDTSGASTNTSYSTLDACETLPDPELDKVQAMRKKRRTHGTTLGACLDEFEREEILSEQDMWFCPRCKEHRRASKKFDIWKTPDILIIHLKRFSSSGFRRDKLEVLVDFPIENLDITSRVLHKEDGKQEVYDLIGVDCHWGGLGGGHYTAQAKNFLDGKWYNYNDPSVSQVSGNMVDSGAYLLFYRRRSEIALGGPRFQRILEQFEDSDSDNELENPGEGRRLDEGSSLNGSSSALQGAGATRPHEKAGGNSTRGSWSPPAIRTVDDVLLANTTPGVHQSIEQDESTNVTEIMVPATGFQPLTGSNSWNFDNLAVSEGADAQHGQGDFDPGAASDEAQHDSSGDERVHSFEDLDFGQDTDPEYPGMSHYELPQQSDVNSLASYGGKITQEDISQVHEVLPEGATEDGSDEAAEIYLDEQDKLKLG